MSEKKDQTFLSVKNLRVNYSSGGRIVKAVGGTSIHWAGASLRFQEHEFKARTTYGNVDGANLLDWPITLSELEPYYDRAEKKLGVTRTNDWPGLPGNPPLATTADQ